MAVSAARFLGQRSMVHRGRHVIGHIDATEGCKGCRYGVVCGWVRGRALSKESGFEKFLVSMNKIIEPGAPTFFLGNILPYFGGMYRCSIMNRLSHEWSVWRRNYYSTMSSNTMIFNDSIKPDLCRSVEFK